MPPHEDEPAAAGEIPCHAYARTLFTFLSDVYSDTLTKSGSVAHLSDAFRDSPTHLVRASNASFASLEDDDDDHEVVVLFVSCNWYDKCGKAKEVARLMRQMPEALCFAAGAVGRLSSKRAVELGSEAKEFAELLGSLGVDTSRLIIEPTGAHTRDNVVNFLRHIQRAAAGEMLGSVFSAHTQIHVKVVEESFLCKRLLATMKGALKSDQYDDVNMRIASLEVNPTRRAFDELEALHRSSEPLWFLLQDEVRRLDEYVMPDGERPSLFSPGEAWGIQTSRSDKDKIRAAAQHLRNEPGVEAIDQLMRGSDVERIQQEMEPTCTAIA